MAAAESLLESLTLSGHGRDVSPKRRNNISRPLLERIESTFTPVNPNIVSRAFVLDSEVNPQLKVMPNFIAAAEYQQLGVEETKILETLDLDLVNELRWRGFLVFDVINQTYYAMTGFAGTILKFDKGDIIDFMVQTVNNMNQAVDNVAQGNFFPVLENLRIGKITDFNAYTGRKDIFNKVLARLKEVHSYNLNLAEDYVPPTSNLSVNDQPMISLLHPPKQQQLKAEVMPPAKIIIDDGNVESLDDNAKRQLLVQLEQQGEFHWSRVPIENEDQVSLIITALEEGIEPHKDTPQSKSKGVDFVHFWESTIVNPITNSLNKRASLLKIYMFVEDYIVEQFKKAAELSDVPLSDEVIGKFKAGVDKAFLRVLKMSKQEG